MQSNCASVQCTLNSVYCYLESLESPLSAVALNPHLYYGCLPHHCQDNGLNDTVVNRHASIYTEGRLKLRLQSL